MRATCFLNVPVVSLLMLVSLDARGQDSASVVSIPSSSSPFTTRKIIASGMVGGVLVGSMVSSYFDWWKGAGHRFHFVHEGTAGDYSLGIDKAGHMYTSFAYFNIFRNIMLWGGYDEPVAFWWAAGTTAFFAVSIEIGDGLTPLGFSPEDLAFNLCGLGFGMLRSQIPLLESFTLKWSYVPPDGYRWPPRFTNHYDGHTYWLACDLHSLLPEPVREAWPSFLRFAVGYGVDDNQTRREFAIGLDFNLGSFDVESRDLRLLRQTLDLYHLPAPAVKFTEHRAPRYYLFHLN
jgi:hypothetical protein